MSVRDLDRHGVEIGGECKPIWDDLRVYGRLDDIYPSTRRNASSSLAELPMKNYSFAELPR
jgi:hypothetical protein